MRHHKDLILDEEDRETFAAVHVWKSNQGYATLRMNGSCQSLHRVLLSAGPGQYVDHINHNRMDNRRKNLRLCTNSENMQNRAGLNSNNTSGVRGVSWFKQTKRWHAQIECGYKRIHLGYFKELSAAVAARKEGEKKHFGRFATAE